MASPESLCTGQVYLPTAYFVMKTPGMRAHAIGYLLLYNVMFITPLVVIFLMARFGAKSERLGDFLRRRPEVLKLAMVNAAATPPSDAGAK